MRGEADNISLEEGRCGRPLCLCVVWFRVLMFSFWYTSNAVLVAGSAVNVGEGEGGRCCFVQLFTLTFTGRCWFEVSDVTCCGVDV